MIEAGKLFAKVIVQTPSDVQSDSGEVTLTWATFDTVWANIVPLNPKEMELGKNFSNTVTHRFTIRYRNDLTNKMRVLYGTRIFYINGIIDPLESKEDTVLYLTEVV